MSATQSPSSPGRIRQSKGSQFADAAFLLVLLFVTLFVTTFVIADDAGSGAAAKAGSISQAPLTDAEERQFQAMIDEGILDEPTAITLAETYQPSDDQYAISWGALIGTVALAVAYLGFVYAMSFREFREVIHARFGREDRS